MFSVAVFTMKKLSDSAATTLFFLTPTTMLIVGFFLFQYPLTFLQEKTLLIPLFGGLLLLGAGFLMGEKKKGSLLRVAGWVLFSFYWATQPNTLYYYEGGDLVNAAICVAGVYVLFYFAYRETLNTKNKPICLNWVAGATSIAGLIYFVTDKIDALRDGLINIVAQQSAWLLSLFSDKVVVKGNLIWFGYHYDMLQQYGSYGATAQIIFACTAIQSMMLFVGMIGALKGASLKTRGLALLSTIPVIYVLNLVRNAGVIFLSGSQITTMEVAHNYIGKFGSLIALIVLVFVVFKILPELYDHIVCLFDLPKQDGPLERELKKITKRGKR